MFRSDPDVIPEYLTEEEDEDTWLVRKTTPEIPKKTSKTKVTNKVSGMPPLFSPAPFYMDIKASGWYSHKSTKQWS
mgnify:CR=1 FL=1